MIQKPKLECKTTGGVVGEPTYKDGASNYITTKTADFNNTGTDINTTASSENLSAKFKNPRVKQDVPEKARGQYMEY